MWTQMFSKTRISNQPAPGSAVDWSLPEQSMM
jgi:hypothetical protein